MRKILCLILPLLLWLPTQASIVVVNGLSHEHNLTNNPKAQGSLVIRNTGEKSKRARLYKTDVSHNCKGETEFSEDISGERCNAGWMSISDNEIVLQGGQSVTVTYELSAPEDIKRIGSYWGVIMVEEVEDLDTSKPTVGVKVNALVRYAIQIIASFETEAVKQLEFAALKLDTTGEVLSLRVGVYNPGNYMMKPVMILELYDVSGAQIARKEIPYQKVYPGMCKLFELPLDGIDPGTYSGILVADCGDENLFGMQLEEIIISGP